MPEHWFNLFPWGLLRPKSAARVAGLLWVAAVAASAASAADLTLFPFRKDLQPPAAAAQGDIGAFLLDHEVYRQTDPACANLRLADPQGQEAPYCIRKKVTRRTVVREALFVADEVVSLKELPDNRVEVVVRRGEDRPVPCGINLHTPLKNYEKQVAVYGSSNRQEWVLLAEHEPVYDYSRYMDVRNERVAFPPAAFAFYRIEIARITENRDSPLVEIVRQTGGAAGDIETVSTSFRKEPFRVDRVSFVTKHESVVEGEVETRTAGVSDLQVTQDSERKQTVAAFSTDGQPVVMLTLQAQDPNFSREVVLEARTDKGEWRTVVVGQVRRVQAGRIRQEHLEIALSGECRARQLRLIVHNQDNPALTLTGIEVREPLYEALFFPRARAGYRLYYGGRDIPVPRYDVEVVLSEVKEGVAEEWKLGVERPNEIYQAAPVSKRHGIAGRTWFVVAMVGMVLVLILVIGFAARRVDAVGPPSKEQ